MTTDLERRYRILQAGFHDDPRSRDFRESLGTRYSEAMEVLVRGLAVDLGRPVDELDGDGVRELLSTLLPARLEGREPYARSIPDLLEAFLAFIADAVGLPHPFEWLHAVVGARESFERALVHRERPRLGSPGFSPDRRPGAKIGRNDPCFCGSGKKYKHCCAKGFS